MKQPIAGVMPAELEEVPQMDVWPSISATPPGRMLGQAFAIRWPDIYIFRLGNLLALLTIPLSLALYFYRLKPSIFGFPLHGCWYRVTNRRVIVLRNEIRPGRAGLARIVAGVATVLFFAVVLAILWLVVYGGTWPLTLGGWIPLLICILGIVAGCIPLLADVPFPRFHYAVEMRSVPLDRFDQVEVLVQPGQEWFAAGDLVFHLGPIETFRLNAVPRPYAFRQVLLKAHAAYCGVKAALERQTA
jgi:hypothetical protein